MSNVSHRGSRARLKKMMRLETMLPGWMRRLRYYGLALLLVAMGATVRWALTRLAGPGLPEYITFYPPVMLAALIGGWGPGLLATLATMAVVDYWLLPPPGLFKIDSMVDGAGLVFFSIMGVFMSIVAELYRRTRDHLEELVLVRTTALSDANAQLQQEITERRQAQEAKSRLAAIVESSDDAIISKDLDGIIQTWNAGAERLLGYRAQEIVGRPIAQLLPPERRGEEDELLRRLRRGEYVEHFETVRVAKDGRRVDVSATISPLWSADGKMIGASKILRDITERKRAQTALQQANEQLQQQAEELQTQSEELQTQTEELQTQTEELQAQTEELAHGNAALRESDNRERQRAEELATFLDAAPTPVIIVHDPDGVHMTGNRAADELLRHARGAEISLSAPPETRPRHFKAVKDGRELRLEELPAQRAARGELVRDFEFSLVFDDGTTRHLLGYGTPLRDENGRPRGAVHILVDITERRRAEEALRELAATLESKVAERTAQLQHRAGQLQRLTLELSQVEDRERKRMAEILHDDVQQIIAAAKFHLSLLRSRVKDDVSFQAIGSQIDQMLRDAIEKSRGLSHELSPAVLHHGDLTETLGWLAHQMHAKHGLVVHVRTPGPVVLQSDALKGFLYKAAQELLFNVVKHARVKEAGIRVRRCGRCVCLSVSDRGRGFDPQELRQTAGFGLLSIRERIELLGGRMKIKSAPGQGSTFYIAVPDTEKPEETVGVGPRAYPASAAAGDQLGGHRGPPLRVLLADDHRIVREGLRLLLSDEHDIEIVGEAAHGREAVDLALRLKPDVVIMDVAMPLIDGDEATRQIKRHLPETRIIALSTYNERETIRKMYRAGAESYVLKTASAEELLAAIRRRQPDS